MTNTTKQFADAQDFLELWGTDHVKSTWGTNRCYYFKTAFGFQEVAYAGLETGVQDRTSYVLQQDKIRLVITPSMVKDSVSTLNEHGDGVKFVALWVPDATKAFEETTKRGAKPYQELKSGEDARRWSLQESIPMANRTCSWSAMITTGFPTRLYAAYVELSAEAGGVEIHRPHGGQCRLGPDEYLGEVHAEVMGFSQIISSTTRIFLPNTQL